MSEADAKSDTSAKSDATTSLPTPLTIDAWQMVAPNEPLQRTTRVVRTIAAHEVVVRVAGCGVCHTDVGYLYEGVATRHPLPLTLGHEIAGVVERAGADHTDLVGRSVVVPAVIPCGRCWLCRRGKEMVCAKQIFPGCDVHGGFASHVVVPGHGVCPVDDVVLVRSGLRLADLSVIGDAVSTAYHAIVRAKVGAGDVVVVVGAGGVGGFAVQIARALGAHVVAMDVDPKRLAALTRTSTNGERVHGIDVRGREPRELRKELLAHLHGHGLPERAFTILETSGTKAGQELAFGLLVHGAHLGVVGYTREPVTLRLSNLMAFDATAAGVWGCPPRLYPDVIDLVLAGKVQVAPHVERRPLHDVNAVLEAVRDHRATRRIVLVPDGGRS
jgi:6-hydroxycyclohex-1-ene-1-carbonyl-CoA dehydrogenase